MHRRFTILLLTLLVGGVVASACGGEAASAATSGDRGEERRQPVHVDSIFPIEEEIRRFREGLDQVETLVSGAATLEGLISELLSAVERSDTAAVRSLAIDRAEFAYLYYPYTIYVARPYELGPGIVWFRSQNRSGRGLDRLLALAEEGRMKSGGFTCPDGPVEHGPGSLRSGCTVEVLRSDGAYAPTQLFGSVLEHEGRFKLVSFANEL